MCRKQTLARSFLGIAFAVPFILVDLAVAQTVVYFNDFEGPVGAEWSNAAVDITPSGRSFLGRFGNETVSLTLDNLPPHTEISISFDLFVIKSWDGNRTSSGGDGCGTGSNPLGPDEWDLTVAGGPTLIHTTFDNHEPENHEQAYPENYPGGVFPSRTGAAENDTLGYGQDTVYSFPNNFHDFTFAHTADSLTLQFTGGPILQCLSDESWGIDNVSVSLDGTPPVCGDGTVDSGEECDPGTPVVGDCCDDNCMFELANTQCEADGDLCTNDHCDGDGRCVFESDVPTDDGDFCTDDVCDPDTGNVTHTPSCLDIKPSSCPNPINPNSNGVVPVALVGSANFDVTQVDISTIELSRADGVGSSVTPHEGPPGPHTVISDVATPHPGELCDCHELSGDGIDDLLFKFKAATLATEFLLNAEPPGTVLELVLTGNLFDGTPIDARDCVVRIPAGFSNVLLSSNASGTFAEVSPLDLNVAGDGFGRFGRAYLEGTWITVIAPARSDGRRFVRWSVNGVMQDFGVRTLEVLVEEDIILRAVYQRQSRLRPDRPTEGNGDPD